MISLLDLSVAAKNFIENSLKLDNSSIPVDELFSRFVETSPAGFKTALAEENWNRNYRDKTRELTLDDTIKRWIRSAMSVYKKMTPSKSLLKGIEKKITYAMLNLHGLPGGRIAANVGIPERGKATTMNCFFHNPTDLGYTMDVDSIEYIMDFAKIIAVTLKSEGGIGMNLSYLRPDGGYIHGIASRTPGPVAFAEIYDVISKVITRGSEKKGEKDLKEKEAIRKGAMMFVLEVWHPDIIKFIKSKQKHNFLTAFNLSVGIHNRKFMEAVEADANWDLIFPDTTHLAYKTEWKGDIDNWLSKGYPVKVHETLRAKELYDLMMFSTFMRNDPGVLYLYLANELNPLSYYEVIKGCNPCGEVTMSTGVCNLANINWVKCLSQDKNGNIFFDFKRFEEIVKGLILFLDAINELANVPHPDFLDAIKAKRRISIGTMGLGSMLFVLGLEYNSPEARDLVEKIGRIKTCTELYTSAYLGKLFGSFELFDAKKYFSTEYWKTLDVPIELKKEIEAIGCMRNSHRQSNPPTGNTAIFSDNCSNGIEPVFGKEYGRYITVPERMRIDLREKGLVIPDAQSGEWFETNVFKIEFDWSGQEVLKGEFEGKPYLIDKSRGLTVFENVIDYGWRLVQLGICNNNHNMKYLTAEELSAKDHIDMLAIVAKFTDMNSSKTINLPENYKFEDLREIYWSAAKLGIKGLTTYRKGTGSEVLVSSKKSSSLRSKDDYLKYYKGIIKSLNVTSPSIKEAYENWNFNLKEEVDPKIKLNDIETSYRRQIQDPNGNDIYMHLTHRGNKLYEVFTTVPKSVGNVEDESGNSYFSPKVFFEKNSLNIFISQLISYALRIGGDLDEIIKKAENSSFSHFDMPAMFAQVMKEFKEINHETARGSSDKVSVVTLKSGSNCPDCGADNWQMTEGCKKCMSCGYTPCG